MTQPVTTNRPTGFVAWWRPTRGQWKRVGEAPTYAEASRLADEYLRTAAGIPQHVETYTGPEGSKPPMIRRAGAA